MTVLSSAPCLSTLISGPALLPIIQADSAAQAVQIAKAMQQGGISAVEVVLRTAAALDGISAIRQQCPELLVGAGTVLSKTDAQLKAYWSKLTFTGKGTPPKELASEEEMMKLVAGNPSLIGFVDASKVDASVKVAFKF